MRSSKCLNNIILERNIEYSTYPVSKFQRKKVNTTVAFRRNTKKHQRSAAKTRSNSLLTSSQIDQFRYIKIQPKTLDFNTRLLEINPSNSVVIPMSLILLKVYCFRLNFNTSKLVSSSRLGNGTSLLAVTYPCKTQAGWPFWCPLAPFTRAIFP